MESHLLPLHCAAARGDTEAARSILSHAECEVDAVSGTVHSTALHVACEKGFIPIVKLLLDRGASLKRCRSYRSSGDVYTALHAAAFGGSACAVDLLVQRGADVHSLANGCTPLHVACCCGHLEAARVLLNSGSDVNKVTENSRGYTALHYAAMNCRVDIVNLLLSRNADMACVVGEDVGKLVRNCAADVNLRDNLGLTALHYACLGNSRDAAEALLNSGADVHAAIRLCPYGFEGFTPLHCAVNDDNYRIDSRIQVGVVELLMQYGADINAKESEGWTSLAVFFSGRDHEQAIAELFAKHVVKMQALDLFVDQSNLQALFDHELTRGFLTACKAEIGLMRKRFIGDSTVTFWNIFKEVPVTLAYYMANESMLNAFESGDFELEFPIYSENLRQQFDLGIERLDLLAKCDSVLSVSNLRCLPYVCVRQLNRYLINDDLQSIIKSEATTQP